MSLGAASDPVAAPGASPRTEKTFGSTPRLRRAAANTLHFLFSQGIGTVLGIAATVVLARTLGPHDLGIFHQVQWFAGTVAALLSVGLMTSVVRFTAKYRAEGRQGDLLATVRFMVHIELFLTGISAAALCAFSKGIADYYFTTAEAKYFVLGLVAIIPGMQTAIFSAMLEGAQVFRWQSLHALIVTPLALLVKIGLLVSGFGLEALLWSNLAFAVVNLVFYLIAARRERLLDGWSARKPETDSWLRELWMYNRPLIGIGLIDIVVWSRSENFFLGRYCQATQIAYYNLAQNLTVKLFGLLPNLLWKLLLPITSERAGVDDAQGMARTYFHTIRWSAFMVFPMVTVCFACAFELVVIFFGQDFAPAKGPFQVLCLGTLVTGLAQPGSAAIYATGRQAFVLHFGAVLAIVNILLYIALIPSHGALGAAWSYTIVTSAGAIGGLIYAGRTMHLPFPWVSLGKILLACAGLAFILFLSLRQTSELFDYFLPLRAYLERLTGHGFHWLLGPRPVRLAFTLMGGAVFYGLAGWALFRPNDDDILMLYAFARLLPAPLRKLIRSGIQNLQPFRTDKGSHGRGIH